MKLLTLKNKKFQHLFGKNILSNLRAGTTKMQNLE